MQKYISHKEVKAAQIDKIEVGDIGTIIYFKDHDPINYLTQEYEKMITRYKPIEGDFLVVYADRYHSFSPAKAFLEGYTKV